MKHLVSFVFAACLLAQLAEATTLPIRNGIAVTTQYSNSAAVNPSGSVIQAFSLNGFTPGSGLGNTPWNITPRYSHPSWSVGSIGEVWGIDMDRYRNVYVIASAVYVNFKTVAGYQFGPGGPGGVYKINGITGTATLLCSLPNSSTPAGGTPTLGNASCHPTLKQLYVTNLEDGKIYRISTETGTILSTYDPFGADDGSVGIAPRGERLWGIKADNNRLLFSRWSCDDSYCSILPAPQNEIWSIAIDPTTGEFLSTTAMFKEMPTVTIYNDLCCPGIVRNNPVSDIESAPWGGYVYAQRMFRGDGDMHYGGFENNYSAALFAHQPTGFTMLPYATDLFLIGQQGAEIGRCGGGVAPGFNSAFVTANPSSTKCDNVVWFSSIDFYNMRSPGYAAAQFNLPNMNSKYIRQYATSYAPITASANTIGDIDIFDKYCRIIGPPIVYPREFATVRRAVATGVGNVVRIGIEAHKSDVITNIVFRITDRSRKDGSSITVAQPPAQFSVESSKEQAVFSASTSWTFDSNNGDTRNFLVGISSLHKNVGIEVLAYVVGYEEPILLERVNVDVASTGVSRDCFESEVLSVVAIPDSSGFTTHTVRARIQNFNPFDISAPSNTANGVSVSSTNPDVHVSPSTIDLGQGIGYGERSPAFVFTIRTPSALDGSSIPVSLRLLRIADNGQTTLSDCSEQTVVLRLPRSTQCCDSLNATIALGSVVVGPSWATVNSTLSTSTPYSRVRVSVLSASMVRACKNKPDQTELIYAYVTNGTLPPFTTVAPPTPQSSIVFIDPVGASYPTGPNQLTLALPPFDGGKKCTDTIRICLRWEFTDADCRTCDTTTCLTIIRKFNVIVFPPSGGGSSALTTEQVDATTGADVDDLESGSGLSIERVYPNPASRKITVDLKVSLEDVIDVDIVAVDGNIVKSFLLRQAVSPGSATLSFDLADLPRGRYSMLVRGRTATTSTSFVCE